MTKVCCIYHNREESSEDTCTSDDDTNGIERSRETKKKHKNKCSKKKKCCWVIDFNIYFHVLIQSSHIYSLLAVGIMQGFTHILVIVLIPADTYEYDILSKVF